MGPWGQCRPRVVFSFLNVLLQISWSIEKLWRDSPCTPEPLSPVTDSWRHGSRSTLMNGHWGIVDYIPGFTQMPLSLHQYHCVSGYHSGHHVTCRYRVSLGSSWLRPQWLQGVLVRSCTNSPFVVILLNISPTDQNGAVWFERGRQTWYPCRESRVTCHVRGRHVGLGHLAEAVCFSPESYRFLTLISLCHQGGSGYI